MQEVLLSIGISVDGEGAGLGSPAAADVAYQPVSNPELCT